MLRDDDVRAKQQQDQLPGGGATVTLKDANISSLTIGATYAGITCNGDTTILLEDSNTVIGGLYNDNGTYRGCYPGIFIAEGHTLAINGTGSLLAKYGGLEELAQYASGIGGSKDSSCGNIVIPSKHVIT
jgi:hypothetical protein